MTTQIAGVLSYLPLLTETGFETKALNQIANRHDDTMDCVDLGHDLHSEQPDGKVEASDDWAHKAEGKMDAAALHKIRFLDC